MVSKHPYARVVTPLMAASVLLASPAGAQAGVSAVLPAPVTPEGCALPAPVDSVDVVVHASLARWREQRPNVRPRAARGAERDALGLVLQTILQEFRAPAPLGFDLGTRYPFAEHRPSTESRAGSRTAIPSLESELLFTLHGDGRVTDLARSRGSAVPALDSALRAHVERLAADGALQFLLLGLARDSVRLALETSPGRDSIAIWQAFLLARVPRFPMVPVEQLPGAFPRYPKRLQMAGIEGEARLRFAVDAQGQVETASAEVVSATAREFVQEIARVLPDLRYRPMTVGGCPVRRFVEAPFVFRIHKSQ